LDEERVSRPDAESNTVDPNSHQPNSHEPNVHEPEEWTRGVDPVDSQGFIRMAVWFEGGLIFLAVALAFLGLYDRDQPLRLQEFATKGTGALIWGIGGMLPLLLLLVVGRWNWRPFRAINAAIKKYLLPAFSQLNVAEILAISVLAGLGEELLFRWAIQGGISWLMGNQLGLATGLFVGSLTFGICHWVNSSYGIITTLIGLYFGLQMVLAGTWLAPALSHALYDFVAILYLTNRLPITFYSP
jgi:membrane protease YdiL (CAAX protease family)